MMVVVPIHPKENAMNDFLKKFAHVIIGTLSCFDRVIFKGHLPFGGDDHLNAFVDQVLKIRRKDFIPMLEKLSAKLVDHAKALAEAAGRPYEYHQGKFRKEAYIQNLLRENRVTEGLVAVLCCQETCRTVRLRYGDKRPSLHFAYRPQRVLYYYRIDPEFGLMYVRIQTWFPYTMQVYVNGHDWLAQQMTKKRIGFCQRDNAFTQLDSPRRAQNLADRFCRLPWVRQLDQWARQFNPLLRETWLQRCSYYWTIQQAEYATDAIFASRSKLAGLYQRLLDYAAVNFGAQDILTFLGRKLHGNFQGEVLTDCKKDRAPGARIKHRMKDNWLKMYDKFGQVLRVETVINNPREFRVRRRRERNGTAQMVWCPMNKGVANFHQFERVAKAANERYLEALAVVDDPAPSYRQVARLAERKVVRQRSYAGFNPACQDDVRLFQAVLHGDHLLRGFYNRDIRRRLGLNDRPSSPCRRWAARVGRLLKRLHVRGLIAKIQHTRRWRLTQLGQQLLGAVVQLHYHGLSKAA
jgi:hypothetical protein